MINIANAEFVLYSLKDWPVERFTSEMGMYPTDYYKVGDMINQTNRLKIETAWKLNKRVDRDIETPAAVLSDLVEDLSCKLDLIKYYMEVYDLSCVLYLHAIFDEVVMPNVQLDRKIIGFANDLDAKFDIYLNAMPNIAC